MSTPRNILDSYRSYSYHHILVACDSVSVAETLAEQGEITLFDADGLDDRYQPQRVPGLPGAGQYVIIFNGASDALFYISNINWTTHPVPSDDPRTAMTSGEMNITEPKGARFLNVLSNVSERLKVDSKGMVFLLKTIFTGYRNDGGYDLITTVDPFLFSMYDISAEFSVTGATYGISFAGIVNGTGRLSEVSAIAHRFSFQLDQTDDDTNTTIETAMNVLQTKLNKRYEKFKKKLKKDSECAGVEINWDQEFIDVEYRIQVDEEYRNFSVGTNEKFLKKNFGGTDVIVVQDGQNMSVERLIESIMMSSEGLMIADNPVRAADTIDVEQGAERAARDAFLEADRQGLGPGPNNPSPSEEAQRARTNTQEQLENRQERVREVNSHLPKYTFKINSTINSTPERYIVTYHVTRHKLPFNYRNTQGETDIFVPNPGEGIVFDYIFTGQNIDILDFNMKMNMGQAFYQSLLTSDSVPSASSYVNYQIPQTFGTSGGELNSMQSGKNTSDNDQDEQSKKPLFLGMSMEQIQRRNKQNSGLALAYDGLLQRFAMYESTATTVTIRGNPQLLAESTPLPSRLIDNQSVPVVLDEESINSDSDATTIIPRMWKQFGYVKINIRMPALNDDDPDFSEQFWYPGWYFISQIQNSFEEGEFTQTLNIHAIPTDQSNQSVAGIKSCPEEDQAQISDFDQPVEVKASNIIKGRGAAAKRITRENEKSRQARSSMSGSAGE